jgi:hypothetical protein
MRKLFWGSAACGMTLAAAVLVTACYAHHHPSSFVGRVLHGASHFAAQVNPFTGFRAVLARLNADSRDVSPEAVATTEPVPAEDDQPPVIEQPAPTQAAPIVIPDDHDLDSTPVQIPIPPRSLHQTGFVSPPADCPGAPATMPFCGEEASEELPVPRCVDASDADAELLPMPAEDLEVLPVPACDEEEQEAGAVSLGSEHLFEIFTHIIKEQIRCQKPPTIELIELPEASRGECREDGNYHRHYPGCPATGPCMPPLPVTPGPTPQTEGPCFPQGPTPAQPRKDDPRQEARKALLEKLRLYFPNEAGPRLTPGCDTMEYRPSDGQLYDYGPGTL